MSGVALAPEAEAAGLDLSVGLAMVAGLVVGIGLRFGWEATFGALINGLANVLDVKVWRIRLDLSGPLRRFEGAIEGTLGAWILRNEQALGLWLHANKAAVEYLGESLLWFASSTLDTVEGLVHGTIPAAVTRGTHATRVGLGQLDARLTAIARGLERDLTRRARAVEADLARDFGKAWRGIDYLTGSLPRRIGLALRGVEADVGRLDRAVEGVIPRRLTRLEKLLGAGVLTGAVVAALTRVFPWWQCSNVRRVSRALCRFDARLLEALLADALEAAVLLDICRSVRLMAATARAFEPELRGLVAVTGAALQCSAGDAPPTLDVRAAALPPAMAAASLPE